MDIGARVRAARRARELSQEALARRADVSLNVVNRLERGVISDPHYSTLVSLADALGMSVEKLVNPPISYGGERFKQFLVKAREKSREELTQRYEELDERLEELSKDPAGLPRKLGRQSSPEELGRYFRELAEVAAEARAVYLVLGERLESKIPSKVPA